MKTIRVDEEAFDKLLVEDIKDTLEYSIDYVNSADVISEFEEVKDDEIEYHYKLIQSCKGVLRHYMYIGDYEEYLNGLKIITSRKG